MNIQVKSTNVELTASLKQYLEKKLTGIDKFIQKSESEPMAEVELGKVTEHRNSGDAIYKAEINLTVGGDMYRYVAKEAELYAAIDKMKDEIVREVRRDKEKKRTLWKRGAQKVKQMFRRGGADE